MAFPGLLSPEGLLVTASTIASITGASNQNDAIEEAANSEIMANRIRAANRKDEIERTARRNIGRLSASAADRNAYGRSSKAVMLDQIQRAAQSENAVEADLNNRILQISSRANSQTQSTLAAGISGFAQGVSLAGGLKGLSV